MNISDYKSKFLDPPPFAYQTEDSQWVIDRPFCGLAHEMGAGKSRIVIDAACALAVGGEIDRVVVISPASVRSVWLNKESGQIRKYAWFAGRVMEFHSKGLREIFSDGGGLDFIVTNYEYLRPRANRDRLIEIVKSGKTLLVADESLYIKEHRAIQTKACIEIGAYAARRVILNGTPITHGPLDLWSQMLFLDKGILPYANFFAFRATFAVIDTRFGFPKIVRYQNLERLQRHVSPYMIRREKKDCLDLPEKIYTQIDVPLSKKTWEIYKTMRDECVVWMEQNPSLAAQAGVKVMRLAQITSGFLGGFDPEKEEGIPTKIKPIGTEKIDLLQDRVSEWLAENPELKLIVWCRFRHEIEQVAQRMTKILPVFKIYGAQKREEREQAIKVFSGDTKTKAAMLIAQPQAGGFGLNLVAATTVVYLSNDFNLGTRLQSEDRVHRPGQKSNVQYFDIVAVGPSGQRTCDYTIVKALREKNEIASWTASAWRVELMEE